MCFWKLSCKKILSLFLLSTLISSGIIEPANAQTKVFGVVGRDGDRGRSGRNGSSGADISIQATNQSKTFNISGSDGSNGELGYSGENASQCQEITYTINIQQIAKSGSRYTSGMRVTQVVDRTTPHPDVTYYRSSI